MLVRLRNQITNVKWAVENKWHKMGVGNPNMLVGSQIEKDSGFYGYVI